MKYLILASCLALTQLATLTFAVAPPDGIEVLSSANQQTDPYTVYLRDTISIGAFGEFGEKVSKQFTSDPASFSKNVVLYLRGVPMVGLSPQVLGPDAPEVGNEKPKVVLRFTLTRDSTNIDNRAAWDAFLGRIDFGYQKVEVGVRLNNELPRLASTPIIFMVNHVAMIFMVPFFSFIAFILIMGWAIKSDMLRADGPGTPYSLGKSQMAFWGTLVAVSFAGVWAVSLSMERIPPQVLILIGISGATGLGSIVITNRMRPDHAATTQRKAELTQRQADLENEKKALETIQSTSGNLDPKQADRLASIARELAAIAQQLNLPPSLGWWRDILTDPEGTLAFHRVQIVMWTMILGVVFASTVVNTFTMPEFEPTLLLLMGISSGTYLGFKQAEQTGVS